IAEQVAQEAANRAAAQERTPMSATTVFRPGSIPMPSGGKTTAVATAPAPAPIPLPQPQPATKSKAKVIGIGVGVVALAGVVGGLLLTGKPATGHVSLVAVPYVQLIRATGTKDIPLDVDTPAQLDLPAGTYQIEW